jgi:multidrug efflux system membrane fusion protein
MKRFIPILIVAAVLAAGWFWRNGGVAPAKVVDVVHPARGPAVEGVYATGTVEPGIMLPIASRGSGRLMELNADEGQDVKKDEVLARIEDSDLQKTMEGLKAKATFAAAEYQRQTGLLKKGYATQQAADQAKADLDSATAAVAAAEAQIGFMQLRAPADGRILRRDGEVGELIPANRPVFWISCCSPLRVSAEVDEEDIPYVKEGLKVLLRSDAFPGKVFHGTVKSITPKGDAVARSFRVRLSLDDDTPLLIGMTVETNIVTQEKADALLVPSAALKGQALWVVKDGRLEERKVIVGVKGLQKAAVSGDISEKDLVAVNPDETFRAGQAVRAREKP